MRSEKRFERVTKFSLISHRGDEERVDLVHTPHRALVQPYTMQSTRTALRTLHAASRAVPSAAPALAHPLIAATRQPQQVRHISLGFDVLRNLLPKRQKKVQPAEESAEGVEAAKAPKARAEEKAAAKGLFDVVTEEEDVREAQGRFGLMPKPSKPASYVR